MNTNRHINARAEATLDEGRWYDEIHIVDGEWIEVSVTTPRGEKVYYRIPRRTLFRDIDEMTE